MLGPSWLYLVRVRRMFGDHIVLRLQLQFRHLPVRARLYLVGRDLLGERPRMQLQLHFHHMRGTVGMYLVRIDT